MCSVLCESYYYFLNKHEDFIWTRDKRKNIGGTVCSSPPHFLILHPGALATPLVAGWLTIVWRPGLSCLTHTWDSEAARAWLLEHLRRDGGSACILSEIQSVFLAWAAMMKYHRCGVLRTKIYFLTDLEAESPKSRCWQCWFSLQDIREAFLLCLSPWIADGRLLTVLAWCFLWACAPLVSLVGSDFALL